MSFPNFSKHSSLEGNQEPRLATLNPEVLPLLCNLVMISTIEVQNTYFKSDREVELIS